MAQRIAVDGWKPGTDPGVDRNEMIRRDLTGHPIELCPERAYLLTEFFREHNRTEEPMVVQKARALAYVLENKKVSIFPGELVVGNAGTGRRVSLMQPEIAGVFMAQEILYIDRRKTNPFVISGRDKLRLVTRVIPYWLRRSLVSHLFRNPVRMAGYVFDQLKPACYLVNETGGIGHFIPGYEEMLRLGTRGYLERMNDMDGDQVQAARIVCRGLERWAERLADEAEAMAEAERDGERAAELREIATVCRKVPREPAESLHEAVQSLWLTHMAVMLESLNSAISFGRLDQVLFPYYERDLEAGRITREEAVDLMLCFSAKATEHVMLLSGQLSEYHGGFLVVQAAVVGGTDPEGIDATNPFTYVMLDVMRRHRMREPNYHARVHKGSPGEYLETVVDVARSGHAVPALYNDEAIVPALVAQGYPVEVARAYGTTGCVEPSIPGRSFFCTGSALFNLPICVELALNQGKRLGKRRRAGAPTADPRTFERMDDLIEAFRAQLDFLVDRMVRDLQMIEQAHMDYNPIPLSSMLVEGCLESGRDLTEGGATYNSSGLNGVGVADAADSLAALDVVVFRDRDHSMAEVVDAIGADFAGFEKVRLALRGAPKYGNDDPLADGYADLVLRMYHDSLGRHRTRRGGAYTCGISSATSYVAFGAVTGALPSGRRAGEPFAPGVGAAGGADCSGPTALLNSAASLDTSLMPNGTALNMRFSPADVEGDRGLDILVGLIKGYFEKGGMQVQFNVVDPETLEDARAHPGKYPELVVRVAGYCAYFDDLPDSAKEEFIKRTRQMF